MTKKVAEFVSNRGYSFVAAIYAFGFVVLNTVRVHLMPHLKTAQLSRNEFTLHQLVQREFMIFAINSLGGFMNSFIISLILVLIFLTISSNALFDTLNEDASWLRIAFAGISFIIF